MNILRAHSEGVWLAIRKGFLTALKELTCKYVNMYIYVFFFLFFNLSQFCAKCVDKLIVSLIVVKCVGV